MWQPPPTDDLPLDHEPRRSLVPIWDVQTYRRTQVRPARYREALAANREYSRRHMYDFLRDPNYFPEPDMDNILVRQMKQDDPQRAAHFLQERQKKKLVLIPWNHFPEYRLYIGALPAKKSLCDTAWAQRLPRPMVYSERLCGCNPHEIRVCGQPLRPRRV